MRRYRSEESLPDFLALKAKKNRFACSKTLSSITYGRFRPVTMGPLAYKVGIPEIPSGARDACLATMLAYGSQRLRAKLVLFHVKDPKSEFRHVCLERPTLNAQATAEPDTDHPNPYSPHSCAMSSEKTWRMRPLPFRPKERRSNQGAGIEHRISLRSRASIE